MRAGREHHLLRPHAPDALARPLALAGRQVIGAPLVDRQVVVVVIAEHGAARQQPHVGHRAQLGDDVRDPRHGLPPPIEPRTPTRGDAAMSRSAQQPAAEFALLVGEDHARTRLPAANAAASPAGPPPDDQHVAVGVHLVVAVGIGLLRRAAEAGRLADVVLVASSTSAAAT